MDKAKTLVVNHSDSDGCRGFSRNCVDPKPAKASTSNIHQNSCGRPLGLHYDKEGDVLYIYFGKPLEAVCVEEEEGLLIRVDPETSEVIGYTIIDFLARFDKLAQHAIQLPLVIDPATLNFEPGPVQALERLYEQAAKP